VSPSAAEEAAAEVAPDPVTSTLTDFERASLAEPFNLADGHAYHGIDAMHPTLTSDLAAIWDAAEHQSVDAAERDFAAVFAEVAGCPGLLGQAVVHVVPTASNSIDIVAAVLSASGRAVAMIEPTFDNLALILRRRGLSLTPIAEADMWQAASHDGLATLLPRDRFGAVVLVNPNNPTGRIMGPTAFAALAEHCALNDQILVVDRSFRLYDRNGFDDHQLLLDIGGSYVVFEDTGKVWPTHDMKASLLCASADLSVTLTAVYNELYLCHSRFALGILRRCMTETTARGLDAVVWSPLAERRAMALAALEGTGLVPDPASATTTLPVLWLDCSGTGRTDLELVDHLAGVGVRLLPGRYFYWASAFRPSRHDRVRMALLKPQHILESGLRTLRDCAPTRIRS
jgi:aspartate/methionine/tyrosine aminotransferase